MYSSTGAASYATFFYAQFDERTRRLTYVNAGHNPPFLLRAAGGVTKLGHAQELSCDALNMKRKSIASGRETTAGTVAAVLEATTVIEETESREPQPFMRLTSGGPVIGVFRSCVYEQETVQLQSGDLLLAYTDGVTEAFNSDGEEFGEERLEELLRSSSHMSADEVRDTVVRCVRDWCATAPQHDDLTFIVLKVK
jgi:sigma-B regulation protein RsbU (phosphoserine phosphatase)